MKHIPDHIVAGLLTNTDGIDEQKRRQQLTEAYKQRFTREDGFPTDVIEGLLKRYLFSKWGKPSLDQAAVIVTGEESFSALCARIATDPYKWKPGLYIKPNARSRSDKYFNAAVLVLRDGLQPTMWKDSPAPGINP